MPKKTIYIILITVTGLLIIGGLAWYFIFRGQPRQAAPTEEAGFTVPGGTTAPKKLNAVSGSPVVSAHFNSGQSAIMFYDFSGQLWQLNNGEIKASAVSQSPIGSLAEIIWSANLKNIVKTGMSQSDAQYIYSDFTKNMTANLKAGIRSLAFSPDAGKITYYIFDNSKTNSLFTSDPDGKNQRTLTGSLKLRDSVLYWPKTTQISLTSRPSGLLAGNIWALDTKTLVFTKLLSGLYGLETLWAPDGNSFIYSYTGQNGENIQLAVYNKKGIVKNLPNISTLVDKCSWSKDSISVYCAVPKSWPDYMILPDDYYKKLSLTNDDVWKINTETGEKNLIVSGVGDIDNLIFNESLNNLSFVIRGNQFLYQLNLK